MGLRATSALVGLVSVWALASCQQQLTPDGKPYRITVIGNAVFVTNTLSGSNNREALWSSSTAQTTDSSECARWVFGTGITQNGLAFRIHQDGNGWDSVVLERNIFANGYWAFRVVYFRSGGGASAIVVDPQAADLGDYLGRSTANDVYPLTVCGDLRGNVLRFSVAKAGDAMVPVGTPGRGATLTLTPPAAMLKAGETGTYIGHVPSLTTATIDSITINGLPAPMPNT